MNIHEGKEGLNNIHSEKCVCSSDGSLAPDLIFLFFLRSDSNLEQI